MENPTGRPSKISFGPDWRAFQPRGRWTVDGVRWTVYGKFPSVPHRDPDDACRRAGVQACGRAVVRCDRAATPSGDVAKP